MKKLNEAQTRHLLDTRDNPGVHHIACTARPGWNAGTYKALYRRGLAVTNGKGYLVISDSGREYLASQGGN